jgi:hypothetical protein
MAIRSIRYFSRSGLVCDGVFGVSKFPYSTSDVQHDGGPVSAHWEHDGREYSWAAADKVSIYPSPDFAFLVVVFLRNAPYESCPPHNALVLNADGSVRHHVRQPARYAGRKTEFLYARWYHRDIPQPQPPGWAFWRKPVPPKREVRMKMLIGGEIGLPNLDFAAWDFDAETGEFSDLVDSGRL